jgi:hypothetical protein
VRRRPPSLDFPVLGAAIAALGVLAAPAALRAQEPQPAAAALPVSATSQCVEGPGAPPADPSQVTRVAAGGAAPAAKADDTAQDEAPGAPSRVRLELGAFAGASVRFDDAPALTITRRAGLVLGGSIFAWPSRTIALGLDYTHAELGRTETPPASTDVIAVDHAAHTLLADLRVVPFRNASVETFLLLGGGLAWQTLSLRATLVPLAGRPGGSVTCSADSGADFAFRAGAGLKAHVSRAVAVLVDAAFTGYRLSADVQGDCWYGAGTAQTLMLRAGLTYDLDITRFVR